MLEELKQYAKDHFIPIICDDGLLFLKQAIESNQVKHVLEIGTAIGYSAIFMAKLGCRVTTFERNENMLKLAKENIKPYQEKIVIIDQDALLYQGPLETYDLIFIDAAKAQYQKFFDRFSPYLNPNGMIICDNLDFHHLDPNKVNRNTRQLLRKIDAFKTYLKSHTDYQTSFYDCGDGMSITKRVNHK